MMKHLGKQSTSLEFLNRAMHRYTEAGCVEDIDRAINRATTTKAKTWIKKHITRNGVYNQSSGRRLAEGFWR